MGSTWWGDHAVDGSEPSRPFMCVDPVAPSKLQTLSSGGKDSCVFLGLPPPPHPHQRSAWCPPRGKKWVTKASWNILESLLPVQHCTGHSYPACSQSVLGCKEWFPFILVITGFFPLWLKIEEEFMLAPGFAAPPNLDYSGYHQYIEEKLPPESPALYGLHANAELELLTVMSNTLFRTLLELQPRNALVSEELGQSAEEKVGGLCFLLRCNMCTVSVLI